MASRAEGPAQASVAGGVRGQVPGGLRFWAKEPSSRGVTVTPGRGRRGWAACCRRDTWAAMLFHLPTSAQVPLRSPRSHPVQTAAPSRGSCPGQWGSAARARGDGLRASRVRDRSGL